MKTPIMYFMPGNTEYKPYEKTIHEHRASTDESIRLYDEMKEKAYNSILKTITIENNTINTSAMVYRDISSFEDVCKYKVMFNGHEIFGELRGSNLPTEDVSAMTQKLLESVSATISGYLCRQMYREIIGWRRR